MSKNIIFEGWLTKSPPTNRIWRTKWRRRWFALRQSSELPGQYFLDYFADRNCRRLKGTINLDLCEQVDAGLHMERTGNGTLDPKLRGSVFTIQTQQRTYHLEADSESDMEKWVDAICQVCGLRATDDSANVLDTYQNNISSMSAMNEQYDCDSTGPYIPISECITGVRAQAFTFDPTNIVMSSRTLDRAADRSLQMYTSQPHMRINTADFSENESNISDEESRSLNASQSNIRDWSVAKTFTKLAMSPKRNGISGPPTPPPRPPKTLQKESYQGPKVQEPVDPHDTTSHTLRTPRWSPHATPRSPGRVLLPPTPRITLDEDDCSQGHQSMQYCNLPSLPPAVDRALKPRHSSIGHINHLLGQTTLQLSAHSDLRSDALQYLDLDLQSSKPAPVKATSKSNQQVEAAAAKVAEAAHGKPAPCGEAEGEADSAYKTVDFLKTEAFNITRQDAEASRSNQQ
ncbi:hypothetical protein O0L34_g2582 [Tuta absoluta]|nr:hypothetical protein O0L34_g2582 [Tuta absoluta]